MGTTTEIHKRGVVVVVVGKGKQVMLQVTEIRE